MPNNHLSSKSAALNKEVEQKMEFAKRQTMLRDGAAAQQAVAYDQVQEFYLAEARKKELATEATQNGKSSGLQSGDDHFVKLMPEIQREAVSFVLPEIPTYSISLKARREAVRAATQLMVSNVSGNSAIVGWSAERKQQASERLADLIVEAAPQPGQLVNDSVAMDSNQNNHTLDSRQVNALEFRQDAKDTSTDRFDLALEPSHFEQVLLNGLSFVEETERKSIAKLLSKDAVRHIDAASHAIKEDANADIGILYNEQHLEVQAIVLGQTLAAHPQIAALRKKSTSIHEDSYQSLAERMLTLTATFFSQRKAADHDDEKMAEKAAFNTFYGLLSTTMHFKNHINNDISHLRNHSFIEDDINNSFIR